MTTAEKLLTETEAAEMLRIKPGTLANWRCTHRQSLPFVRIGQRAIRYRLTDLQAFIERHFVQREDPIA